MLSGLRFRIIKLYICNYRKQLYLLITKLTKLIQDKTLISPLASPFMPRLRLQNHTCHSSKTNVSLVLIIHQNLSMTYFHMQYFRSNLLFLLLLSLDCTIYHHKHQFTKNFIRILITSCKY